MKLENNFPKMFNRKIIFFILILVLLVIYLIPVSYTSAAGEICGDDGSGNNLGNCNYSSEKCINNVCTPIETTLYNKPAGSYPWGEPSPAKGDETYYAVVHAGSFIQMCYVEAVINGVPIYNSTATDFVCNYPDPSMTQIVVKGKPVGEYKQDPDKYPTEFLQYKRGAFKQYDFSPAGSNYFYWEVWYYELTITGSGPCVPNCSTNVCGYNDGCGGICGTCPGGTTCSLGKCVINNQPPIVSISGPNTGQTGVGLSFTGNASDSDGNITNYSWDFGDGTSAVNGVWFNVPHTYTKSGNFTIKLTVTDNKGATAQATKNVTINLSPPAANGFSISPMVYRGTNTLSNYSRIAVGGNNDTYDLGYVTTSTPIRVGDRVNIKSTLKDIAGNVFIADTYVWTYKKTTDTTWINLGTGQEANLTLPNIAGEYEVRLVAKTSRSGVNQTFTGTTKIKVPILQQLE